MKDAARAHARCLPPLTAALASVLSEVYGEKSSRIFREKRVTGARKYGGLFHYRQRAGFQNQTGVELTQRAPATAQAPPILTAIICFGSTPVSESPPRRAPGHPETAISEKGLIVRVD